jgi:hypothetical protein
MGMNMADTDQIVSFILPVWSTQRDEASKRTFSAHALVSS